MNKLNDRLQFGFENEWADVIKDARSEEDFNWVNFTFIRLEFDIEHIIAMFNLYIGFMGFKVLISWRYKDTEEWDNIMSQIEELENERNNT